MSNRGLSLVQGPPGTGKTTLFESAVNVAIDKSADGRLLVYMAPTNRLVAEMLEKVAFVYKSWVNQKRILQRKSGSTVPSLILGNTKQ